MLETLKMTQMMILRLLAGLDADELEFMDSDERAEALEEAGLEADDYDFD